MNRPLVTVIIPCYRSAAYLADTVRGIQAVFDEKCPYRLQLILIDDCSPDETGTLIRRLAKEDPRILGIGLARNAGQAAARTAAYPYIRGSFAVFMDDDGQHPADQIPRLVEKTEKSAGGLHIVYAAFPELKESLPRRAASSLNNLFMSLLLQKPLRLRITSFFCIDRAAIRAIRRRPRSASFVGGYILPRTKRAASLPVPHRARREGASGYTLRKLLRHWAALVRCRFYRGPETQSAVAAWTTGQTAPVYSR